MYVRSACTAFRHGLTLESVRERRNSLWLFDKRVRVRIISLQWQEISHMFCAGVLCGLHLGELSTASILARGVVYRSVKILSLYSSSNGNRMALKLPMKPVVVVFHLHTICASVA